MRKPFLLALALASLGAVEARANNFDSNCSTFPDDVIFDPDLGTIVSEGYLDSVADCHKTYLQRESLLTISNTVRSVVADRLLGNGPVAEPAGLRLGPEAARRRMAEPAGIVISPTADVVQAAPARRWNAWVDGKYSYLDSSDDLADTDGPLTNAMIGLDYKFTDRFLVGLIGTFEDSDLDTGDGPDVSTETEGYGGGLYVGLTLTDHLAYSGMVTGTWIDTDYDFVGIPDDTTSDRLSISNGVTGYWYFGTSRYSPSVTFAWSKEWQEESLVSADQSFETGVITFGHVAGHTFALANGMAIEPWLGANFDWTVINVTKTDGAGTDKVSQSLDLRLQAGFTLTVAENIQFALTGEASGLFLNDSDTYAGQANLAIQF